MKYYLVLCIYFIELIPLELLALEAAAGCSDTSELDSDKTLDDFSLYDLPYDSVPIKHIEYNYKTHTTILQNKHYIPYDSVPTKNIKYNYITYTTILQNKHYLQNNLTFVNIFSDSDLSSTCD